MWTSEGGFQKNEVAALYDEPNIQEMHEASVIRRAERVAKMLDNNFAKLVYVIDSVGRGKPGAQWVRFMGQVKRDLASIALGVTGNTELQSQVEYCGD